MLKFFAAVALAMTLATSMVLAQPTAPFVTPGAANSKSTIAGQLITMSQHYNSSDMFFSGMVVVPYLITSGAVAATASADQVIIIKLADGAQAYNMIWNFTVAESDVIKGWLNDLPLRNNLEVSIIVTWDASGRFTVTPTDWKFTQGSLFPYGVGAGCNVTKALVCLGTLQATIPFNCVNHGVPELKRCLIDNQECLAVVGKGLVRIHEHCETNRQAIDVLFCNDGRIGGDAICNYVKCSRPSGKLAKAVTEVTADGQPKSGSACSSFTMPACTPDPNNPGGLQSNITNYVGGEDGEEITVPAYDGSVSGNCSFLIENVTNITRIHFVGDMKQVNFTIRNANFTDFPGAAIHIATSLISCDQIIIDNATKIVDHWHIVPNTNNYVFILFGYTSTLGAKNLTITNTDFRLRAQRTDGTLFSVTAIDLHPGNSYPLAVTHLAIINNHFSAQLRATSSNFEVRFVYAQRFSGTRTARIDNNLITDCVLESSSSSSSSRMWVFQQLASGGSIYIFSGDLLSFSNNVVRNIVVNSTGSVQASGFEPSGTQHISGPVHINDNVFENFGMFSSSGGVFARAVSVNSLSALTDPVSAAVTLFECSRNVVRNVALVAPGSTSTSSLQFFSASSVGGFKSRLGENVVENIIVQGVYGATAEFGTLASASSVELSHSRMTNVTVLADQYVSLRFVRLNFGSNAHDVLINDATLNSCVATTRAFTGSTNSRVAVVIFEGSNSNINALKTYRFHNIAVLNTTAIQIGGGIMLVAAVDVSDSSASLNHGFAISNLTVDLTSVSANSGASLVVAGVSQQHGVSLLRWGDNDGNMNISNVCVSAGEILGTNAASVTVSGYLVCAGATLSTYGMNLDNFLVTYKSIVGFAGTISVSTVWTSSLILSSGLSTGGGIARITNLHVVAGPISTTDTLASIELYIVYVRKAQYMTLVDFSSSSLVLTSAITAPTVRIRGWRFDSDFADFVPSPVPLQQAGLIMRDIALRIDVGTTVTSTSTVSTTVLEAAVFSCAAPSQGMQFAEFRGLRLFDTGGSLTRTAGKVLVAAVVFGGTVTMGYNAAAGPGGTVVVAECVVGNSTSTTLTGGGSGGVTIEIALFSATSTMTDFRGLILGNNNKIALAKATATSGSGTIFIGGADFAGTATFTSSGSAHGGIEVSSGGVEIEVGDKVSATAAITIVGVRTKSIVSARKLVVSSSGSSSAPSIKCVLTGNASLVSTTNYVNMYGVQLSSGSAFSLDGSDDSIIVLDNMWLEATIATSSSSPRIQASRYSIRLAQLESDTLASVKAFSLSNNVLQMENVSGSSSSSVLGGLLLSNPQATLEQMNVANNIFRLPTSPALRGFTSVILEVAAASALSLFTFKASINNNTMSSATPPQQVFDCNQDRCAILRFAAGASAEGKWNVTSNTIDRLVGSASLVAVYNNPFTAEQAQLFIGDMNAIDMPSGAQVLESAGTISSHSLNAAVLSIGCNDWLGGWDPVVVPTSLCDQYAQTSTLTFTCPAAPFSCTTIATPAPPTPVPVGPTPAPTTSTASPPTTPSPPGATTTTTTATPSPPGSPPATTTAAPPTAPAPTGVTAPPPTTATFVTLPSGAITPLTTAAPPSTGPFTTINSKTTLPELAALLLTASTFDASTTSGTVTAALSVPFAGLGSFVKAVDAAPICSSDKVNINIAAGSGDSVTISPSTSSGGVAADVADALSSNCIAFSPSQDAIDRGLETSQLLSATLTAGSYSATTSLALNSVIFNSGPQTTWPIGNMNCSHEVARGPRFSVDFAAFTQSIGLPLTVTAASADGFPIIATVIVSCNTSGFCSVRGTLSQTTPLNLVFTASDGFKVSWAQCKFIPVFINIRLEKPLTVPYTVHVGSSFVIPLPSDMFLSSSPIVIVSVLQQNGFPLPIGVSFQGGSLLGAMAAVGLFNFTIIAADTYGEARGYLLINSTNTAPRAVAAATTTSPHIFGRVFAMRSFSINVALNTLFSDDDDDDPLRFSLNSAQLTAVPWLKATITPGFLTKAPQHLLLSGSVPRSARGTNVSLDIACDDGYATTWLRGELRVAQGYPPIQIKALPTFVTSPGTPLSAQLFVSDYFVPHLDGSSSDEEFVVTYTLRPVVTWATVAVIPGSTAQSTVVAITASREDEDGQDDVSVQVILTVATALGDNATGAFTVSIERTLWQRIRGLVAWIGGGVSVLLTLISMIAYKASLLNFWRGNSIVIDNPLHWQRQPVFSFPPETDKVTFSVRAKFVVCEHDVYDFFTCSHFVHNKLSLQPTPMAGFPPCWLTVVDQCICVTMPRPTVSDEATLLDSVICRFYCEQENLIAEFECRLADVYDGLDQHMLLGGAAGVATVTGRGSDVQSNASANNRSGASFVKSSSRRSFVNSRNNDSSSMNPKNSSGGATGNRDQELVELKNDQQKSHARIADLEATLLGLKSTVSTIKTAHGHFEDVIAAVSAQRASVGFAPPAHEEDLAKVAAKRATKDAPLLLESQSAASSGAFETNDSNNINKNSSSSDSENDDSDNDLANRIKTADSKRQSAASSREPVVMPLSPLLDQQQVDEEARNKQHSAGAERPLLASRHNPFAVPLSPPAATTSITTSTTSQAGDDDSNNINNNKKKKNEDEEGMDSLAEIIASVQQSSIRQSREQQQHRQQKRAPLENILDLL